MWYRGEVQVAAASDLGAIVQMKSFLFYYYDIEQALRYIDNFFDTHAF